jgi:DNA-3-methyladenine glycosylase II
MDVNSEIEKAQQYLIASDPILANLIEKHKIEYNNSASTNFLKDLIGYIISQQLSEKAAKTIKGRFFSKLEGKVTPDKILEIDKEVFYTCGISKAKTKYIVNIAEAFINKKYRFTNIAKLKNNEVIDILTEIKGVGQWTAEMFLMFSLKRLDVFPINDVGIKRSIMKNYNVRKISNEKKLLSVSKKWGKYQTIACLYLWKDLDSKE